jgi:peptide/nickel transport system ATP-binding protein
MKDVADPIAAVDDPVVEVRDANIAFDMDRGRSVVLDSASLGIERQEILGIVWESGSGKSMFASALLNAVPEPGVPRGEITYYPPEGDPVDVLGLDEEELTEFRWEDVSLVFPGAMGSFNPVQTIDAHFRETLAAHGYPVEPGMERARELIADLYMEPSRVLDSYPHELSGGMRQRALIALSLLLDPDVLVMDEPTSALDLLMQRSIIGLIEEIKETYDLTILFISHNLPLVTTLADRIGVMYAFEFVELSQTEDILENPAHPYTRALLKSTPDLETPLDEIDSIDGNRPDPANTPSGCSYHPRCPLADAVCETDNPGASTVEDDHQVRCHFWEDAADAVPFPDFQDRDGQAGSIDQEPPERPDTPVVRMQDIEMYFGESEGIISELLSRVPTLEPDPPVRAVDGVDLDIYEDDIMVVAGESGCGKTTLGKISIGLHEPTAGTVEYRGQDIWESKRRLGDVDIPYNDIRRSLQIIHQDPDTSLNSMRRINAILEEPLKRWYDHLGDQDRKELIAKMLDHVGIDPPEVYMERYPHELSGGEKQRMALVRALFMNPDVILADEPISALDVSLRVEMMDLMHELQDMFGTSYVFITHNLANARYLAGRQGGRIAIMYLGEIMEVGSVDEVLTNPRHPYTEALLWATPKLNLGQQTEEEEEVGESPLRGIDIPDPSNPPRGCRFHTRCSHVIPPPEYDFEQEEWLSVFDLKLDIEDGQLDYETLVSQVTDGTDEDEDEAPPRSELADRIRAHYGIPQQLTSGSAEEVLEAVIEHLLDDEPDQAEELIRSEFSTICQDRDPEVDTTQHRATACFLYAEEGDPTTPEPS